MELYFVTIPQKGGPMNFNTKNLDEWKKHLSSLGMSNIECIEDTPSITYFHNANLQLTKLRKPILLKSQRIHVHFERDSMLGKLVLDLTVRRLGNGQVVCSLKPPTGEQLELFAPEAAAEVFMKNYNMFFGKHYQQLANSKVA
jgi:hypothetical protein